MAVFRPGAVSETGSVGMGGEDWSTVSRILQGQAWTGLAPLGVALMQSPRVFFLTREMAPPSKMASSYLPGVKGETWHLTIPRSRFPHQASFPIFQVETSEAVKKEQRMERMCSQWLLCE